MLSAILLPDESGASLAASATSLLRQGQRRRTRQRRDRRPPSDDARAPSAAHRWSAAPAVPDRSPLDLVVAQGIDDLVTRDALRLWCRLVQELTARVAAELERRLVDASLLPEPGIAQVTLAELEAVVGGSGELAADLRVSRRRTGPAPVPHTFHLGEGGEIVPRNSGLTGVASADGVLVAAEPSVRSYTTPTVRSLPGRSSW